MTLKSMTLNTLIITTLAGFLSDSLYAAAHSNCDLLCYEPQANEDTLLRRTLFTIARTGDAADLQKLIAKGFDIDTIDNTNASLLIYAAHANNFPLVQALIDAGARLNTRTISNYSPYVNEYTTISIAGARLAIMKKKKRTDLSLDPQHNNPQGKTALMVAAWYGHTEIAVALIKAGANYNIIDNSNTTAREWATTMNHIETRYAMESAILEREPIIDARLRDAITDDNLAQVQELIAAEIALDTPICSALHQAVLCNRETIAQEIIAAGANLNFTDSDGRSLVKIAIKNDLYTIARMLINSGATLKGENRFDESALEYASRHANWPIVELITTNLYQKETLPKTFVALEAANRRTFNFDTINRAGSDTPFYRGQAIFPPEIMGMIINYTANDQPTDQWLQETLGERYYYAYRAWKQTQDQAFDQQPSNGAGPANA